LKGGVTMNSYQKINLDDEESCGSCGGENNALDTEMESIRIENQGIKTVAFSVAAVCSAIVGGAAVSAAAYL